MKNEQILLIDAAQHKLLSNTTRVQLLYLLKDEPKTAKQAAELMEKSPGSVHYHIKQLYEGGLVDLVDTRENGGVLEKYYQSKSTSFRLKGAALNDHSATVGARLKLSHEEKKQFLEELSAFLGRWESRVTPDSKEGQSIAVDCVLTEIEEEDGEDNDQRSKEN